MYIAGRKKGPPCELSASVRDAAIPADLRGCLNSATRLTQSHPPIPLFLLFRHLRPNAAGAAVLRIALRFLGVRRKKMESAIDLVQRLPVLENAGIGIDVELLFVYVVLHAAARNFVVFDVARNDAEALQRLPKEVVVIFFAFEKAVKTVQAERRSVHQDLAVIYEENADL